MKKYLLFLIALITGIFSVQLKAQDIADTRIFQPSEMQQDFNYLRKALEDTHPGLYMHHTKAAMQNKMDSLYNFLNKPMVFRDFYKIIAYLIAEVKCEHTYCNPYGADYNKRAVQWKLIPMQLFFENNKAYVTINRSTDTSVHLGDEVLSINHYPIDSVQHEIYKYLPSDGNMESSKESMISNMAFNLCYYLFIEKPEAFNIEFKNAAGQIFTRHFDSELSINENNKIAVANPANKEVLQIDKREGKKRKIPQRLELIKDKNTAIITIRDFGGDRQKLFKQYDKFFTTLQKKRLVTLLLIFLITVAAMKNMPVNY